ncbi:uncharacterized protein V6R79_011725 [Siganus canaliculatus]
MDRLKAVLGREPAGGGAADSPGIVERANQAVTLSWGSRVKGFAICFVLGAVSSILGTCMLWIPGVGLAVFAVFYSVGNICALLSTVFLVGPCRQLKNMCAVERALTTATMLVFLALTLCAAFVWKNAALALLFVILQFLAFTWYSLSYIPFAR